MVVLGFSSTSILGDSSKVVLVDSSQAFVCGCSSGDSNDIFLGLF